MGRGLVLCELIPLLFCFLFFFFPLRCLFGFDLRFSEVWSVFLFSKRRNRGIRCMMLTMCFFLVHIVDSLLVYQYLSFALHETHPINKSKEFICSLDGRDHIAHAIAVVRVVKHCHSLTT